MRKALVVVYMIFLAVTAFSDPANTVVYITQTGSMYHRRTCSSLQQSKNETTLVEAVRWGLGRCSICNPPVLDNAASSSAGTVNEAAFFKFYDENRDKTLFENIAGSKGWEIQTYERIEGNSIRINMLFTFQDEKAATERGEAIGRDCLSVMFKWLEKNRFNVPTSRGLYTALY
jgi:hypothetical protein